MLFLVLGSQGCHYIYSKGYVISLEQLKAFLAKVKGDSNLQEKLKAARSPEDVVGIAKKHGFKFTADKFNELSDYELEGVDGSGCGTAGDCGTWACARTGGARDCTKSQFVC